METIAGFRLERVEYDIEGYVVHRAVREGDGAVFLAKSPGDDFPPLREVERLDHELRVLGGARPEGALRPLERIDEDRTSYLILEHFEGHPVAQQCGGGVPIRESVSLGLGISRALSACHERGISHLRVSPNSVLWDRRRESIRLTHFGYSVCSNLDPPRQELETSLTLCSAPEQTGRLDVAIDRRADWYALGNVLFFALSGGYPFDAKDRHELIHSLLAADPPRLCDVRPEVPEVLSDLVSRLLVKNPAEREGDPRSVERELETLARELASSRAPTYRRSSPPPLAVPRLVGRSTELDRLEGAAEDAAKGAAIVIRLSGAAGSGKTALLTELADTLHTREHRVLWGKFEQFQRARPYDAVLSALEGFTDKLLSGPQAEVQRWQLRLGRIDRMFRAVLVEQVPKLRLLLGDQPPPQALDPKETENRFRSAFHTLLDAMCGARHPIVLLLDDVQWADEASLELVRRLFADQSRRFVMLVLAHRKDGQGLLDEESWRPLVSEHMRLEDLTLELTTSLCDAALQGGRGTQALGRLVHTRSHGNPLFSIEVLSLLRRASVIEWSPGDGGRYAWTYSGRELDGIPTSEDVVGLIVERLDRLPPTAQALLKCAACYASATPLALLAAAVDLDASALQDAVSILCSEGLAKLERGGAPGSGPQAAGDPSLRFVHDRVQQAARSLCAEAELTSFHRRIGHALWRTKRERGEGDAYRITSHLNLVADALSHDEQRALAELNLEAGEQAHGSAAYRIALASFRAAVELADRAEVAVPEDLRFHAARRLGECLYLCSEFDQAERSFDELLARTDRQEQRLDVHRTRMVLYLHLQRYGEAITVGLAALAELGVRLPQRPSLPKLAGAATWVMLRARRTPPGSLTSKPDRTTARERRILDFLILLWTPSFWIDQNLNGLVGLELAELSFRYGTTSESAMAFACYAVFNHIVLKRYEQALAFADAADEIARTKSNPFIGCRVDFITLTFFGPFRRSNQRNIELYRSAMNHCIENGEHVFAGCCIDGISSSLPVSGFRIPEVRTQLDECEQVALRIGGRGSQALIGMVRKWCDLVTLGPPSQASTAPPAHDAEHEAYTGVFDLLSMMVHYIWGKDEAALEAGQRLRGHQIVQSNPLHAALFDLVMVLASCRVASLGGGRRLERARRRSLARLERFAGLHRENFTACLLLARAECARLRGAAEAAVDAYRRCLVEAAATGHYFVHAVAAERLAALYDARGEGERYAEYLRVAAYSYGRWGATAKVSALREAHPGLPLSVDSVRRDANGMGLDAEAVMRASFAIAEETRGDRLTERLLTVLTTTAGAQRGFLIKELAGAHVIHGAWSASGDRRPRGAASLEGTELLSEGVVRYVLRTLEPLHLADASSAAAFRDDPYVQKNRARSILCVPLMTRGTLLAVIYLENDATAGAFSERQLRLVTMLGHQAAIALGNADYYKVQLETLQARIRPHFLYNALSVIAELVVADPARAEQGITKLARLYQYLSASTERTVTLDEELGIVAAYVSIEQLRFPNKLDYELEISGDPRLVRLPALTLQPLVENSVKHGIAPRLEGGKVRVRVHVGGAECVIRVEDDGLGWGNGKGGSGMGLKNIRERLALAFGSDHRLAVEERNGVTVTLTVPL